MKFALVLFLVFGSLAAIVSTANHELSLAACRSSDPSCGDVTSPQLPG